MVGIIVSFWDGLFSGAMLVSGSVLYRISYITIGAAGFHQKKQSVKFERSRFKFVFHPHEGLIGEGPIGKVFIPFG